MTVIRPSLILSLFLAACGGAGGPAPVPDTADGLKGQIQAILAALKEGKGEAAKGLVAALGLPDPAGFFLRTFGDEVGPKVAEPYARNLAGFADSLASAFKGALDAGRTELIVLKIDAASPDATGLQKQALAAMKSPVALYTVKMVEPGKTSGSSFWSFVYVDGCFRLTGKMNGLP